jgi:DNA-directed RNA polymerase specialized sigma24 family protein
MIPERVAASPETPASFPAAWLAENAEAGELPPLEAFTRPVPPFPQQKHRDRLAEAAETKEATEPRIEPEPYNPNDPNLWLYRKRTLGMLRRYMRLSVEVGRLPSLLGREFFRTRVTSYTCTTFEDLVIFVHDVERALGKLSEFDQRLIARLVFEDHTQRETGDHMGWTERTVQRRFFDAVDVVSEIFLAGGLLDKLEIEEGGNEAEAEVTKPAVCDEQTSCGNLSCGKPCQEGEAEDFDVSGW